MQGMGATAIFEDGHEWRALRSKQYTYARYLADDSELLFDNLNDPFQLRNLAHDARFAPLLGHYRGLMRERMEALNDSFQPCTWYQRHWIEDRCIQRSCHPGLIRDCLRWKQKTSRYRLVRCCILSLCVPEEIRTPDTWFRRPVLYPLSYRHNRSDGRLPFSRLQSQEPNGK